MKFHDVVPSRSARRVVLLAWLPCVLGSAHAADIETQAGAAKLSAEAPSEQGVCDGAVQKSAIAALRSVHGPRAILTFPPRKSTPCRTSTIATDKTSAAATTHQTPNNLP
jgi:hypothetical protein